MLFCILWNSYQCLYLMLSQYVELQFNNHTLQWYRYPAFSNVYLRVQTGSDLAWQEVTSSVCPQNQTAMRRKPGSEWTDISWVGISLVSERWCHNPHGTGGRGCLGRTWVSRESTGSTSWRGERSHHLINNVNHRMNDKGRSDSTSLICRLDLLTLYYQMIYIYIYSQY